jgi:hypothetical protein
VKYAEFERAIEYHDIFEKALPDWEPQKMYSSSGGRFTFNFEKDGTKIEVEVQKDIYHPLNIKSVRKVDSEGTELVVPEESRPAKHYNKNGFKPSSVDELIITDGFEDGKVVKTLGHCLSKLDL